MNKSTHFTGQPTYCQLINLIPKELVLKLANQYQSDRYCKKFTTWNHLATMLFSCWGGCTSLREVSTGMRALEGKLVSSRVNYFPTRSTFSDANARHSSKVFEEIYFKLKDYWDSVLSDSRKDNNIFFMDSTVISLFQEIFKNSGSSKADGRRKGGLKVHTVINEQSFSPQIVNITDGAVNDISFMSKVTVPAGSTIIMDRGYRSYKYYNLWTKQNIRWVTRLREPCYWRPKEYYLVSEEQKQAGVLSDERVCLGFPQKKTEKVKCRLIRFWDPKNKKEFEYLTNDFISEPATIADLYKKRWAVELLFKRLKQNMPLQYFLGENQNAIRIQIWCALIADLLINVIKKQVKKSWAFSSIVSLIRLHLFNYLNLISFLNNPESAIITSQPSKQIKIVFSG
ncbi:IS4 family transposase [Sporocytophaga myxococcoides]|uniref:IS4 family transposase n=1 Tax=Sporocytophaga myxococcoides TaxID=153721 RepID=UPI0003F79C72|nr:IS4 family transposase [Sporocytophaga myxococcoides]